MREDPIRVSVQFPAQFQGGDLENFRQWVFSQIKYPTYAADNGIQGTVILQFVVNKQGKIDNVKVLRSMDASLDQEAVRVIKLSPTWTPAQENNKNYSQIFTLPINFVLQK